MNRSQRGSAAIETAVIAPVLILLISLVIFGGRVAMAHQSVQAAAADAARAASLERTQAKARNAAVAAVARANDLPCQRHDLTLDLNGFDRPVGSPAQISATLSCQVPTLDLGLPGLGTITVRATMTNPLDTYRERR